MTEQICRVPQLRPGAVKEIHFFLNQLCCQDVGKTLTRLIKREKERRLKLLKIRNESGNITTKLIERKNPINNCKTTN